MRGSVGGSMAGTEAVQCGSTRKTLQPCFHLFPGRVVFVQTTGSLSDDVQLKYIAGTMQ